MINKKLYWNPKEIEPYICPVCKSTNIDLLNDGIDDGIYVEKYICKDCESKFNNTFSIDFMGTELIKNDKEN